ncbi:MAG: helix-turn-helix domain-containing protein [Verrucomicrobiota bacterium]
MNPTIQQLRELRTIKGWNRENCAARIGVTARALRSWEEGARSPKPIVLRVLKQFVAQNSN